MGEKFARAFYISNAWIQTRREYAKSKGNLCERCAASGLIVPGDEVHHKQRLTPLNLNDPSIALCWDNLELLCKECHIKEHGKQIMRTDECGHVEL